ncbi:LytTR family transcriptional regulator DNA-binding domain-containing protein [Salinimicrobium gaetbulicola]|uniref:LytTR family transcriptional regulator DNA-binding domain-containing protein n=1 Tax=Salinimicrobium gaetbulicola TaxID=999702 RepID=A0ABW3IGK1_9FLAO
MDAEFSFYLNSVELMLSKDMFARIHRSFIVSLRKITAYSNYHVELGKVEIPIGRKYKGTFRRWEF